MKITIQIPKFLHELFGTQQNRSELILIILFTIISTLLVAWFTAPYWQTLTWVSKSGLMAALSGHIRRRRCQSQ
jgi:hypothetical protein